MHTQSLPQSMATKEQLASTLLTLHPGVDLKLLLPMGAAVIHAVMLHVRSHLKLNWSNNTYQCIVSG